MDKKVFLGLVSVLLLTACGETAQSTTDVIVEATDFAYSPLSITVPAGQPVTLTLKNAGEVEHDFVVEKIKLTDVHASDSEPAEHHQMGHASPYDLHFFAKPGETAFLQFTAVESGTYEIFCSIEGHKEAGMIGKLIVTVPE